MTSGAILPSIGSAPPEFQRPVVPANLRPKGTDAPVQAAPERTVPARPIPKPDIQSSTGQQKEGREPGQATSAANLGGTSAVLLQIRESGASQAQQTAPSAQKTTGRLTDDELAAVSRLQNRDREVRTHENAHATAGGGYTSAPSFEYVQGPDGLQYAVGGHVDIDVSEVRDDPKATIAKMDIVRRAALAPARPSGQDRSVAAAAAAKAQEAQAELSKLAREAGDDIVLRPETDDQKNTTASPVNDVQQSESQTGSFVSAPQETIEPDLEQPSGFSSINLIA